MSGERTVLGVDLGMSWASNGSALLSFAPGAAHAWRACSLNVLAPQSQPPTAASLASAIDTLARERGVHAASLDGPQGWRDPNAGARAGVGRCCEYAAGTPGKTGPYGVSYPKTWINWIRLSIGVFDRLRERPHVHVCNDGDDCPLELLPPGHYYLLECFPTSTWRSLGLQALPGHRRAGPTVVRQFAERLRDLLNLPATVATDQHDHLQAVVAALPAAAVLGGPVVPIARGIPAIEVTAAGVTPQHVAEGLIWDAAAPAAQHEAGAPPLAMPEEILSAAAHDVENPLLPDARDPAGEDVLERGACLFLDLVERANRGDSIGIGYGEFVARVFGVRSFPEVSGHAYRPSDSGFVVRLAVEVTAAAGGRRPVTKNGVTIEAGMDTFIWQSRSPFDRSPKAWTCGWATPPYSPEAWRRVFPDGTRSLLGR